MTEEQLTLEERVTALEKKFCELVEQVVDLEAELKKHLISVEYSSQNDRKNIRAALRLLREHSGETWLPDEDRHFQKLLPEDN